MRSFCLAEYLKKCRNTDESKQHVPENISNANKGVSIFGFVKDLFMFFNIVKI